MSENPELEGPLLEKEGTSGLVNVKVFLLYVG